MPETPTAAELPVPAEAMAALDAIAPGRNRGIRNDVQRIAAPVVAAELRAQAAFLDRAIARRGNTRNVQNINKAYAFMARVFRDRAAELDPPARQEDWPMDENNAQPLAVHGDEQVLVTRNELWSLGADLHEPTRALWLAENTEGAVAQDVRERLRAMSDRPVAGAAVQED